IKKGGTQIKASPEERTKHYRLSSPRRRTAMVMAKGLSGSVENAAAQENSSQAHLQGRWARHPYSIIHKIRLKLLRHGSVNKLRALHQKPDGRVHIVLMQQCDR